MGIAVLLGYLSSTFFVFCGVLKMVTYIKHQEQLNDYAVFLGNLAIEGWPLAVGTALYLLTQIALQCEKQAVISAAPVLQLGSKTPPTSKGKATTSES
ncbi:MAG: hypothetical protein IKV82_05820 [Akkermansia sp.]|nr:hypothetical protein [Akkermansia sp.]